MMAYAFAILMCTDQKLLPLVLHVKAATTLVKVTLETQQQLVCIGVKM